nr:hypothetical protein [Demequina sediminis]
MATPSGDTSEGLVGHDTHEAHLDVAEVLNPGLGQRGVTRTHEAHVRSQVLPLGAAQRVGLRVEGGHHARDQVVVAAVELVVTHRGDVQTSGVERVDRGLVLGDEALERRRADQVACGNEHRVGVVLLQVGDRGRQ